MSNIPIGPYTRRILRWYDRATPEQVATGLTWYGEARTFAATLAAESTYTLEQVAGVIAVLSPQVTWDQNMRATIDAVRAHSIDRKGLHDYPGYRANVAKAFRVLDGDIEAVRGPKVTAFHAAIIGDLSHVVLDVWACRVARSLQANTARVFRHDEMPGAKERRSMAEAYRRAAAARGIAPAEMQAITWVAIRASGMYDRHHHRGDVAWYRRQNRARLAEGLSILAGDHAWGKSSVGQAEAVRALDQFETAGVY